RRKSRQIACQILCSSPSLRRHYPDQVPTVGGTSAALSALGGLPLHVHATSEAHLRSRCSDRPARQLPSRAPRVDRRVAAPAIALGEALLRLRGPAARRGSRG